MSVNMKVKAETVDWTKLLLERSQRRVDVVENE